MNYVDIIIIVCVLLSALLGFKKGVIKSLVQFVGFVCVIVFSYLLKDYLADFLMGFMPFFNIVGFEGISSINILIYELLAFVVIFIVLYCILSILITLSGIVEKLLKMTIVLALPSKLLGAIVGAIEGIIMAFLIVYIMFNMGITTKAVDESYMGVILLERTPFLGQIMAKTTLALEETVDLMEQYQDIEDEESRKELDAQVLSTLVHYQIIDKDTVQDLIDEKKIKLENVMFR